MIDEIATDKANAMSKCEGFLNLFKKISPNERGITKQAFRNKEICELENNRAQDIDLFVFAVTQPKVQKSLEKYLEALKSKGSKPL